MTGIRNTLPYNEIEDIRVRDINDGLTEWQTIEIPLDKKRKWRISNPFGKNWRLQRIIFIE